MEIRFWQYLTKEPTDLDALPLKQRIPEVALFRGCSLQAGFFSNQRGLLQKRDGKQFTKQFLLDRLLALSAKTAEATDLCAQTPVAILRRHAPGVAGPPKAHVLNASQLMELLERTERGFVPDCPALPHLEDDEEWSLQSLIVPPTNLRVVSVYSRENGEECFDLVGQPFSQVYPLDGKDPSPGSSSSSNAMRSVFIPDAFASQVEAKSKHLVAYVQRFHGRGLGSLISEFIPDDSGKAVLHGFWKVDMLEGKTMIYTASGLDSPMPSTAVPSVTESNHTSRPTSASLSAAQSRVFQIQSPHKAKQKSTESTQFGVLGRLGRLGRVSTGSCSSLTLVSALFLDAMAAVLAPVTGQPVTAVGHVPLHSEVGSLAVHRPLQSQQKPQYFQKAIVAGLVMCQAVKVRRSFTRRRKVQRLAVDGGDDDDDKLKVVVRKNVLKTVCRVGLWSVFTAAGAYLFYPSLQQFLWTFLTGTKTIVPLGDVAQGYVGNVLALMSASSVLFSILAGNSYTSLYSQNEAIFCALFAEVSEAKALMEQIALVCSGRPFYRSALENIRRYVERDLRRLDRPPSILCACKPRDDPLESILYLTSVGVYETVRSLRQRRGDRLGAVQRKLPPVQMALLYVLGGFNLNPSAAESQLCRMLFASMAGALMMTMRVIHELWTPVGGAYNVDGVLRVMIRGLEDELDQRLKGKTFSDTRLPPPPPSFPARPAETSAATA
eukprot:s701_g6.t1